MTVAIYTATPDGMLRVGTFRSRYTAIRAISEEFCDRHPNADPTMHYMAYRRKLMGKWVDGERIAFDCGSYQINWDNGHACGALPGHYHSERAAERAGAEWKREMMAIETTAAGRREANEAYQWEVVEIEPVAEVDPEAAPDNPRPEWA